VGLGDPQAGHHNTKLARIHVRTVGSHASMRRNIVIHEAQEASLGDLLNRCPVNRQGVVRQSSRPAKDHVSALGETQILLAVGPKVRSRSRQACLGIGTVFRHHSHVISIEQLADRLV
jgi:hypothetical protein